MKVKEIIIKKTGHRLPRLSVWRKWQGRLLVEWIDLSPETEHAGEDWYERSAPAEVFELVIQKQNTGVEFGVVYKNGYIQKCIYTGKPKRFWRALNAVYKICRMATDERGHIETIYYYC